MNLNSFEKNVRKLRQELSKAEETGYLEGNFDLKLDTLTRYEENLLMELLPIIRSRKEGITTEFIKKCNLKGSYNISGYPKEYIYLKDNLFLILSTNGKLYTMEIIEGNNEVEWKEFSSKIKDIFYMKKIGRKIYFIKTNGEMLILDKDCIHSREFISIFKGSYKFEFILEVNSNLYFIDNGNEVVSIFQLNKDGIEFLKSLVIEEIVDIDILDKNKIIVIDINNKISVLNEEFILLDYISVEEEIYLMKILKNSYTKSDDIFISGENGNYIYKFDGQLSKNQDINIMENIIFTEEQNDTAICISDLGNRFVLEENLGQWIVNKSLEASENLIFAMGYDTNKYILIDLDGVVLNLKLNRLTDIEDLRNMSMY